MSRVLTLAMSGESYGPVEVISTNANKALPANIVTQASRNALRATIFVVDNDIRYAFGGVIPVPGGLGFLLGANETLTIGHPASVNSFRYVSGTANVHANLQITGEYGTL